MKEDIRMPITKSVITAAKKRKIPVKNLGLLGDKALLQLGKGKNIKWTRGAVTSNTKYLSMKIAHHKNFTNLILKKAKLPVPKHFACKEIQEAKRNLKKMKFPIVVKPATSRLGFQVYCDITSSSEALKYFKKVRKKFPQVVIEEQIKGKDFRVLIVNGKLVAAMERIPPFVLGDGKSSIKKLIDIENKKRAETKNGLKKIAIDLEVRRTLRRQKLNLNSILKKGEKIYLRRNANISTGGVGIDVTEKIHPENIKLAKKAVSTIGLDIGGVDIIVPDISKPYFRQGGKIIEVNGGPDAAIHHFPVRGKARFAGEAIVEMLFPK